MLPLIKTVSASSAFKVPDAVHHAAITNESTPKAFIVVIFVNRSASRVQFRTVLLVMENFLFFDFACPRLLRIEIRIAGFSKEKNKMVTNFLFANGMSIYRVAARSQCRGDEP